MLISIVLQGLFLASDVYTLVQIYALKNWQDFHTITYIPVLAYKIVFTACIGISFIYVIFVWVLGIVIQRRNHVVSSYLHIGARQIDSLKSYERFCIYEEIQTQNIHEWLCLTIYSEYHYDIINWLLADTPRQILNGATIAYSVSNKFTSDDLTGILSTIAKNDKEEAVLLSFMFFSFVIWLCFTFKNVIVIISSICIVQSAKRKSNLKFNKYCADLVARSVSELYEKKAKIKESEFSKRRKVPSFMKNVNYDNTNESFINLEDETYKDISTTSFSNNYSSASIEKSNPFDIELRQIPTSYSRTNLVYKSTTNLYDDAYNDPFYKISENNSYIESTASLPHKNNNNNNNNNINNNNNTINDVYEDPEIDFHEDQSEIHHFKHIPQATYNQDNYEYVPSKVLEENYHNGQTYNEEYTIPQFADNNTREADSVDYDSNIENDNSDNEVENPISETAPKRFSALLYGSRGLASSTRNIL